MNIRLLLLSVFLIISITANAQYRALTLEGGAGKGLDSNTEFYGGSVNFHWGFNEHWYLLNWNGISYDVEQPYQRWLASEVSMNRAFGKVNNYGIGAGIQYRNSMVDGIDGYYAILKVRKTFLFK
ncbi:hypothetical protein [Fodinibius sp. AD559]|uniref:hypothetical protein n=1 Tax=Fodinibius sp. AD559 TaxID=3424179 RepID=UPI004046C57A